MAYKLLYCLWCSGALALLHKNSSVQLYTSMMFCLRGRYLRGPGLWVRAAPRHVPLPHDHPAAAAAAAGHARRLPGLPPEVHQGVLLNTSIRVTSHHWTTVCSCELDLYRHIPRETCVPRTIWCIGVVITVATPRLLKIAYLTALNKKSLNF